MSGLERQPDPSSLVTRQRLTEQSLLARRTHLSHHFILRQIGQPMLVVESNLLGQTSGRVDEDL